MSKIQTDINYKEYCKDCPYLYENTNNQWACDLQENLLCENQYLICAIAESEA